MDFDDTADEARFRTEVRSWLAKHVEERPSDPALQVDQEAAVARARRFLAAKTAEGYSAITYPKEYGGYGGSEIEKLIFQQEQDRYDIDTLHGSDFFAVGIDLCGGTILRCGSDEQKQRFIAPLLRGEKIWCQLFSEPACGSDLAAVRTKAVRDGDDWLITGQKVWTTGGHFSDYGLCLTRTDPTVPKHAGLTMFVVDMHQPGVDVQPIRQMGGEAEFNQVFLDNVRVPDSDRIGSVGGGWKVALTTLGQERSTAGGLAFLEWETLLDLARTTERDGRPAIEDGRVRERLAECWLNTFGMKLMSYRSQTALGKGTLPGPEESMAKLIITQQGQRSAIAAMDMVGTTAVLSPEVVGSEQLHAVEHSFFWAPAFRIAGGADEILKNILAERVLGLPSDVRVDRDLPFNELTARVG